jgi:MFS family permease
LIGMSEPTIGELVSAATQDLSTLVRAELELAKLELRASVRAGLRGSLMVLIAAVFGFFVLIMLLAAAAEGLVAAGVWRWLAYLIVAGVLIVLAVLLIIIAKRSFKKVSAPQRTMSTTKDTLGWAKHPTQPPVSG